MFTAYASVIDVLLLLTRGDEILLALRQGTGYADGQWNLPSGKLEADEHLVTAVIRETHEEIGLLLSPDDVNMIGTVHYRNPEGQTRAGFFFHAVGDEALYGEPYNAEPDKCMKLAWYPINLLPINTVPYTAAGVELFRSGAPLALVGW
jgi:8-oxo-dGTP diphosphatase